MEQKNNTSALCTLIIVFFFWGFLSASNGIFIPFCKIHFQLTQFQSQLVDSAFYGAYFIGSLMLYLLSTGFGYDILNRIGFKNGIIYGLIISVIGALCMIPAVNAGEYIFILLSFFVIALGFSLQQTAANPFVIALGDSATGAHRLTLAGGINSLGTTVGPIIVTLVLFGTVVATEEQVNHAQISSINSLYIILGVLFLLVAIILFKTKMPRVTSDEGYEKSDKATKVMLLITGAIVAFILIGNFLPDFAESYSNIILLTMALMSIIIILLTANRLAQKNTAGWGAMKYPQLVLGMIAIFVYVGVEVSIQSNMGALLKTPQFGGLNESQISHFISLYWGSLMIGRWTGAVSVFKVKKLTKIILTVVVPFLAFGLVLLANWLSGNHVSDLYVYAICIVFLIIANFLAQEKPAKLLMILAILGVIAISIGLLYTGKVGLFAFISAGLVCSIMWPCIFTLSITGLGKFISQGSSFLIMMILGGAIIPPLQGGLADLTNIHRSYIIAVICFAYLAFFAWKVGHVLAAKNTKFEFAEVSSH